MNKRRIINCFKALLWASLFASVSASASIRIASASAVATLKTEAEYRSEARRYEDALKLIAQVKSMNLATPENFKQAFALLDRAKPDIQYYRSKLIALALSDSAFVAGVKRRVPTQDAAEGFLKGLVSDPRLVWQVDGGTALRSRLVQSGTADATVLSETAEKLTTAANKLKKSNHARVETADHSSSAASRKLSPLLESRAATTASFQEPVGLLVAIAIFSALVVVTIAIGIGVAIGKIVGELLTTEDKDGLENCQRTADRQYSSCMADANQQGFPMNLAYAAGCYAAWLGHQRDCLLHF